MGSLSRGSLSRAVSVWGVSVKEGLCEGGSLSRGLCPGGLCPGESLSSGVSVQGGFCPGGSLSGGSLSRGVSVQGGLCPGISVLDGGEGTLDQRQRPSPSVDRETLLKILPCSKLGLRAVINLERNVNIVSKMTFAMGECRNLTAVCSKLEIMIFLPIELFVNNQQTQN